MNWAGNSGKPGSRSASGPFDVPRLITRQDKYSAVARQLQGRAGTLIDVGSRDGNLRKVLDVNAIQYFSSDLGPGHDYQLNLEDILPMPDRSFDIVVALDVLEHVEHIHQAFHELARLARHDLIIALPNMASLRRRCSFFWRGHLLTDKYDLLLEHQKDRHRWLTVYSQANAFIEHNAAVVGFKLINVVEQLEGCTLLTRIARLRLAERMMPKGLMTGRCIYFLVRVQHD